MSRVPKDEKTKDRKNERRRERKKEKEKKRKNGNCVLIFQLNIYYSNTVNIKKELICFFKRKK